MGSGLAPVLRLNGVASFAELALMAEAFSQAQTIRKEYRDKPNDLMLVAMMGADHGWHMIRASQSYNVMDGTPSMTANAMRSIVMAAGHMIEYDITSERVIARGRRCDTGQEASAEFSMKEAHQAGLVKPRSGWEKYAEDMMLARATSRIVRRLFADVEYSAYTPDELGGELGAGDMGMSASLASAAAPALAPAPPPAPQEAAEVVEGVVVPPEAPEAVPVAQEAVSGDTEASVEQSSKWGSIRSTFHAALKGRYGAGADAVYQAILLVVEDQVRFGYGDSIEHDEVQHLAGKLAEGKLVCRSRKGIKNGLLLICGGEKSAALAQWEALGLEGILNEGAGLPQDRLVEMLAEAHSGVMPADEADPNERARERVAEARAELHGEG
ncbi:MAG: hypothetical protein OXG44_12730 [Gammaproteobacteria bacterium]|nr:hypothetical protein [Gammaproteobacteria bacterium]